MWIITNCGKFLKRWEYQTTSYLLRNLYAGQEATIRTGHGTTYWLNIGKVKVAQSCLTLCNPLDCIVHGILQARTLEWVAFPFFRGSSQPRDRTQVSHIAGGFFTSWATREAQQYWSEWPIPSPGALPGPGIELGFPACTWILH